MDSILVTEPLLFTEATFLFPSSNESWNSFFGCLFFFLVNADEDPLSITGLCLEEPIVIEDCNLVF